MIRQTRKKISTVKRIRQMRKNTREGKKDQEHKIECHQEIHREISQNKLDRHICQKAFQIIQFHGKYQNFYARM